VNLHSAESGVCKLPKGDRADESHSSRPRLGDYDAGAISTTGHRLTAGRFHYKSNQYYEPITNVYPRSSATVGSIYCQTGWASTGLTGDLLPTLRCAELESKVAQESGTGLDDGQPFNFTFGRASYVAKYHDSGALVFLAHHSWALGGRDPQRRSGGGRSAHLQLCRPGPLGMRPYSEGVLRKRDRMQSATPVEEPRVSELDANDDGRGRRVPRLVIAIALIALLVVVGVGVLRSDNPDRGTPAEDTADLSAFPVSSPSEVSPQQAGTGGVLQIAVGEGGQRCLALAGLTESPTVLIWPPGYTASGNPLAVSDETGAVVARVGQRLSVAGGFGSRSMPDECGATYYFRVSFIARATDP